MSYTIKNIEAVEDLAERNGLGEQGEVRFPRGDLDAAQTGLSHQRLNPGKRQQFGHRHDQAEEIYVVLDGSGRMRLDDEVIELTKLDAIRVSPKTMRALEAGEQGLEILVFGPHFEGDGELVPGWWSD